MSPKHGENVPMIAVAQIHPREEMRRLVREISMRMALPGSSVKERIRLGARAVKIAAARFESIYYGKARRLDVAEADQIRAVAQRLGVAIGRADHLRAQVAENATDTDARIDALRQEISGFRAEIEGLFNELRRHAEASPPR